MTPPALRHDDQGTHGGPVVASAGRTRIAGRLAARLDDVYACALDPQNRIVTAAATVRIEGRPAARDGDRADCGATMIASQTTVYIEGGAR